MLFPVNRETRKLIAVIRDLLFLIAVNCAQDPPLRPLLLAPMCDELQNKAVRMAKTGPLQ